jgi:penicillin amidase
LILAVFVAVIAAFAYQLYSTRDLLEFGRVQNLQIKGSKIKLWRGEKGMVHMAVDDLSGFARGIGYTHAMDRYVQLFMQRIIGQGRLCETMMCNNNTLTIDRFMIHNQFYRNAKRVTKSLSKENLLFLEQYSQGVNAFIENHSRPLEFLVTGYTPEPWTPEDTVLVTEMIGFVGLAQTQFELEKSIIEMIQRSDITVDLVKRLYEPYLDQLDKDLISLIRKVKVYQPHLGKEQQVIQEELKRFPSLIASNAWVVDGSVTESGNPILSADPHLDVMRLPGIWYEIMAEFPDGNYNHGVSIPGVAAIVMGRSKTLAYAFTYGFMDKMDYFIEECDDQASCKDVDGQFKPLIKTVDKIVRKIKGTAYYVEQVTFETHDGRTIETPLSNTKWPGAGYYLSRAYSHTKKGGLGSVEACRKILIAKTVRDFMQHAKTVDISCNWVVADNNGTIGYLQTGLLPDRKHSGLYPVPAWKQDYKWGDQFTVEPDQLLSFFYDKDDKNSPHMIISANDAQKGVKGVNAHMGTSRSNRIRRLLTDITKKRKLTTQDMKNIQMDIVSDHAQRWMQVVRPVAKALMREFSSELDTAPEYQYLIELARWDGKYDSSSIGAIAFETWYEYMLIDIYSDLVGNDSMQKLMKTSPFICFYHYLDKHLIEYTPQNMIDKRLFWQSENQTGMIDRTIKNAFHHWNRKYGKATIHDRLWNYGDVRQVYMKNIFFRDVPDVIGSLLGIHFGPFVFVGSRGTPHQGQIFKTAGVDQAFGPSFRIVTDLGTDQSDTVLAGGVSGNIFSPHYMSDVQDWIHGRYKTIIKK